MNIEAEDRGYKINIKLGNRITLLRSDIISGEKVFKDIMKFKPSIKESSFSKIRFIDEEQLEDLHEFKTITELNKNCLFIIDRVPTLLTDSISEIINYDNNNFYLLIGQTASGIDYKKTDVRFLFYNKAIGEFSFKEEDDI